MNARIKCNGCGAELIYKPGTQGLTCNYCNQYMKFEDSGVAAHEATTELDLKAQLLSKQENLEQIEKSVVACAECGASTELQAKQQSNLCPFCEAPLVLSQARVARLIKPKGLLPFKFEKNDAALSLKKWLGSLWFAPSALKQCAQLDKLQGIYFPFWTYDCLTFTNYNGERGVYYQETITEKDAQGKLIERSVQKTRWHSVSGNIQHHFDDVLVPATKSFSEDQLDSLAPWDLESLVAYKDEYLRGFVTEVYQIDVKSGFVQAKAYMGNALQEIIKSDIGGDEQKIETSSTRYSDETFKHILLPVWVSAYHYKGKLYQVLVNARTGQVYGQRPWSWIKIVVCTSLLLGTIAALIWWFQHSQQPM